MNLKRVWGHSKLARGLASLVGCGVLLAGCGGDAAPVAPPVTLTVMAAASLAGALTEIGREFTAVHPGVDLQFSFAGSQQLVFQLAQGAPADVFASADDLQMNAAIGAGRVMTGTPRSLATNRLVIIYPAANPAHLDNAADLARPGVKLLVADPAAPIGRYTQAFFDRASHPDVYGSAFARQASNNIVSYEENVKAVLSKVVLGEADAGIVYASDVSGTTAQQVGQIDVPDALNSVAQYFIAPITNSRQPGLAQAFVDLAASPAGQAILAAYGFAPASGTQSAAP